MGALDGQVVVFTGAGAGIGRSVVTRYVAEGARVVALDLSESVKELPAELGDSVIPIVGNVVNWDDNVTAARAALDTWGRIDVFVGNAGITDNAQALEDIDGDQLSGAFGELFGVNVLAPMLGAKACLDALIASRGSIILTGSFASTNAAGGGALYTASKHAVHGLVRQLGYELAPDVRVNGIAPGVAPTRLRGTESLGQQMSDSVLDGTEKALPLQEVASVSAYDGVFTMFASRTESAAMTGTLVTVDSGLSIRGIARPGGRVRA
ncbi:SDR family NAD(P)-dependent oxidoreductase [Rhodococcus sp. HNM0563]|uniref:SDR family NAD(P)-dependent oxidoreductase n=1 Tax=unclassified Rhodococcus (in: high G+C Gram-positive bacteria) TaxID=192944 RepID=UPI00146B70B9|nr:MULTISPECIES: SDR family NAD(P)-dependent oxidoreductase [unclassified Rhodococcus (in: high G+C Gram-positive bacteria)]MCK0089469.1 SDR family oxidoreductase [Rhodococcus sp. F64268]NLU62997.1 SDR family NAD(P)-dependent oxidoreductase [Rhodococcus sp. HNM0563]